MWKDYSESYIKNNRGAAVTIMTAVLIGAMFLSLLCSLFFNFWTYEVERIELEEGGWHGRITAELSEEDLSLIRQFENVERVERRETLSGKQSVVDIYFQNMRTVYTDMPLIAQELGVEKDEMQYHELLLSRYLVNDPQDPEPPLLIPFYLFILVIVSFSLILIIRNSFEISMNARIHQFGIFSSVGASPKQIRTCLLQEAAALSIVPLLVGTAAGIGLCFTAIAAVNYFLGDVPGRHVAVFGYHPAVFGLTIGAAVLTVLFSVWIPARKLSRMTPLEAIRGTEEGMRKARKKQLAISKMSLLSAFLGFSMMLCFFTLSGISTRYTYFERYQDAWDVMVSVKNTELSDFTLIEEVQNIPGVQDAVCYEEKELHVQIPTEKQSDELLALGGLEALAGDNQILAPVIVMDDESFLKYCEQIGAEPSLDGTVVLNRIWDSVNSNFRNKEYIPFVRETFETISEVSVLFYAQEPPVLREEYDNYALVQFMPHSLWKTMKEETEGVPQTEIRVLAEKREPAELNAIEAEMVHLLGSSFEIESENRIQEKISNDEMIRGAEAIFGAFCVLLALIGIAGVFTNTLGFLRQRKREFAQYLSVGMTPADMRKMFCREAAVIAGQPIVLTLLLTAGAAELMTAASHLERSVFWKEAPVVPILMFALMILMFVALAYYIGGRRVMKCDLSEVLKDDCFI